MADADRQLPELRLRWEEARCNHDWTTELDAKQLELARHTGPAAGNRPGPGANWKPPAGPPRWCALLDQADAARKAFGERQALLTEAAAVRDRCQAEHEKARAALEQAAAGSRPAAGNARTSGTADPGRRQAAAA